MPWKFCDACKRQYNDKNGGCKNRSCSEYDPGAEAADNSASVVAVPAKVEPPKVVVQEPVKPPVVVEPKAPVQAPSFAAAAPVSIAESVPFTLNCYRGEKSEWWPEPKIRLISGMTIRDPWVAGSMTARFAKLQEDMRARSIGNVAAYAQYLRAEGRPYALATARTGEGSFTSDYNYHIQIPNARLFAWGKNLTLGEPLDFADPASIDQDYIVLNADSIAASTILGFGHKTATCEVTFFHDMPIEFVRSCNATATAGLGILPNTSTLAMDVKIKFSKLFRR